MADSAIQLNSGSGGSNVDTRTTTGGEHREVVVLGEGAATSDALVPADATGLQVKQPTAANLNCTEVNSGNALTSLQLIDDVVHASDAALSKVAAIGAQFDDVSPGTTTENNVRPLRMSTRRELYTQLRDAAGNERGANVNASNQLSVSVDNTVNVNSHAVTNAGTFAVQESGTQVQVDDAAFSPATSKILMVGAEFDNVAPDSVDEGDGGALRMSGNRNLFINIRDAAGNERGANVDATNRLSVSVDNTPGVTANAGTNLNTSALALETGGNLATIAGAIKAEDAIHSSGDSGVMALGVRKDADAALQADGDYAPLQVDANGYLKVNIKAGAGSGGTASTDDAAFTVAVGSGTPMMGVVTADSVDSGDVGVVGMLANRQLKVTLYDSSANEITVGKQYAEDSAHVSADLGVMSLGVRKATLADLSAGATDGDYEPFQVNRDGAMWVVGAAGPTGGWDVATGSIGATKTDIGSANTAGQIGGWYIFNANTSAVYVQFFNTQASGVTLGSTAPVYSLGIPASSAANVAPGMVGLKHSTAICIAITTTRAGSTGPSSTVDYNLWYKQ